MKSSGHDLAAGNFESGRDHADTSANETAGAADAERPGRKNASADRADGARNHAPNAGEASADPSGHAEGEEEIEVTEEMIEAGIDELKLSFSSDGTMDDYEGIVIDVFRAMTRAVKGVRRSLVVP